MKSKRNILLRLILTALSAAAVIFIFYNSSVDADASSEQSGFVLKWLSGLLNSLGFKVELTEHFVRKTAHFIEYFVLGGLLSGAAYSYVLSRKRMLFIALPAGLAVAVCDELIQTGSAGRSCEIKDMALDFSAVLCAALILCLMIYLVKRRKKKKGEMNDG